MPPVWHDVAAGRQQPRARGSVPALIASRMWMSTMCSAPADSPAVKPQSSIVRALQTAAMVETSGGCFRSRSGRSLTWL